MSDQPNADQADQDDNDPDIDVPPDAEVDVPDDVLQEFLQSLDAYEEELRQRLGEQFEQYEDIDHDTKDAPGAWVETDHPRVGAGQETGGQFTKGSGSSIKETSLAGKAREQRGKQQERKEEGGKPKGKLTIQPPDPKYPRLFHPYGVAKRRDITPGMKISQIEEALKYSSAPAEKAYLRSLIAALQQQGSGGQDIRKEAHKALTAAGFEKSNLGPDHYARGNTRVQLEPGSNWQVTQGEAKPQSGQGLQALQQAVQGIQQWTVMEPAHEKAFAAQVKKLPPKEQQQAIYKHAQDIARSLGFDPKKLILDSPANHPPGTFSRQCFAYANSETGEIGLMGPSATEVPAYVGPAIAHEVFHHRYHEAQKKNPAVMKYIKQNMAELTKTDGVTDYTARHWRTALGSKKELKARGLTPALKVDPADVGKPWLAIDETLADIAALEHSGSGTKNVSPVWMKLYQMVKGTK